MRETKQDQKKLTMTTYRAFFNFVIYAQFGAIWKPNSGATAWKAYIFIDSNLLPYKT